MKLIVFLIASSIVLADSSSERALHAHIQSLEEQVAAQQQANHELRQAAIDVKASRAHAATVNSGISSQIQRNGDLAATQAKTHDAEKAAVEQAQEDSSQTLINSGAVVKAQMEFEKQLTELQRSQNREMYLVIILTVVVLSFSGVIIFDRRRGATISLPVAVNIPGVMSQSGAAKAASRAEPPASNGHAASTEPLEHDAKGGDGARGQPAS